jgi:hypothetical protein
MVFPKKRMRGYFLYAGSIFASNPNALATTHHFTHTRTNPYALLEFFRPWLCRTTLLQIRGSSGEVCRLVSFAYAYPATDPRADLFTNYTPNNLAHNNPNHISHNKSNPIAH